mgnify:CR=1 FL=1
MEKLCWTAGVDLGGTKIQVIQVNAFGTVGKKILCPTGAEYGHFAIENKIIEIINQLIEEVGCGPNAIGVGVAGQVDEESGIVKFAPNLKWSEVPFQTNLRRAFGIPVVVINDVRAATWGEWLRGAGKGFSHLLCIFIGTGIGGGIVCDGKMLSGYNNTAGEIGHITVSLNGPKCTCGNFGCMEAYAGGWALAKRAVDLIQTNPSQKTLILQEADGEICGIRGFHVLKAAKKGDEIALQIVEEAVEALGAGVAGLINTLSPECIIFGGGVIEGFPEIIESIKEKAKNRALSAAFNNVQMTKALLHNEAGAIGAGALAMNMYMRSTSRSRE